MDYGKVSYIKLNELTKRVEELAKKNASSAKTLGFTQNTERSATSFATVDTYSFLCNRVSDLIVEYTVTVQFNQNVSGRMVILLNDIEVDSVDFSFAEGSFDCYIRTGIAGVLKGTNILKCVMYFNDSSIKTIKRISAYISGEYIARKSSGNRVRVCDMITYDVIAQKEKERIVFHKSPKQSTTSEVVDWGDYYCVNFDIESLRSYVKTDVNTVSHSGRLILFRTDTHNNLYYTEVDMDLKTIALSQLVAKDVTSFSVGRSALPSGIVVGYTTGQGAFYKLLKDINGKCVLLGEREILKRRDLLRIDMFKDCTGLQFIITDTKGEGVYYSDCFIFDSLVDGNNNFSFTFSGEVV